MTLKPTKDSDQGTVRDVTRELRERATVIRDLVQNLKQLTIIADTHAIDTITEVVYLPNPVIDRSDQQL